MGHSVQVVESAALQSDQQHPACSAEPVDGTMIYRQLYPDTMVEEVAKQGADMEEEAVVEPPALPERSSLRASRLLDKFKLADIEPPKLSQTTPHDVYLSSEEDASSSADDLSDYEYDSSSEESQKSPVLRRSPEIMARAVSVVFSGRPSIVDVSTSRRSASPNAPSSTASRLVASSPTGRPSTSSTTSASSCASGGPHPSRLASRKKPQFLKIDPFSRGSTNSSRAPRASEDEETGPKDRVPPTPKTPSTVLESMRRSLSVKRRRSRPALGPRDPPGSPPPPSLPEQVREAVPRKSAVEAEPAPSPPPRSHTLAAPAVPSLPQPQTPPSPQPSGTMKGFLAMARRRSLHIRATTRI